MNYVKKMKKKKPQDSSLSATDISMLSLETIKKNLNVGDVYTQTELCKILGQPIFRNSNQRKAQLKTFQRFFDLTKEDNLIIIDKIYDTIQPVTPRKIREDSVYAQYMQYLLMNYLYLQEGNVAAMTSRQWWVVLSLINENYHKLFSDNSNDKEWIKNVASYITDEQIQNFKSRTSNKYYNIFNQTLKSMEDKRFIMSEKVYMVGTDWCDLHEADSDEKELWLETDRAALQELNKILLNDSDEPAMYRNLKTVSQVYRKEQKYQDKFHELKHEYKKKICGWNISYQKIRIIFTKFGMKQAIDDDTFKVKYWKKQLNHNAEIFFNRQIIEKTHPELLDKYSENENLNTNNLLKDKNMEDDEYSDLYNELMLTEHTILI